MNEVYVSVIRDYTDEYLFEPASNWPEFEFYRRSYARWASDELITRIMREDKTCNPIKIIRDFICDLDHCAEMNEDKRKQFIFEVAKETVEELALLFV